MLSHFEPLYFQNLPYPDFFETNFQISLFNADGPIQIQGPNGK